MSIFPNKDQVFKLVADTTELLFQYLFTKRINGFQIISINKNLIVIFIVVHSYAKMKLLLKKL